MSGVFKVTTWWLRHNMLWIVCLIPLWYNLKGLGQSLKDEEIKDDVYRIKNLLATVYLHKWIRESSFNGAFIFQAV